MRVYLYLLLSGLTCNWLYALCTRITLHNDDRQNSDTGAKPPLQNRIKPAEEWEIQQIMDNFNSEYDDVVKATDLYNLDAEECTTA